MSRIIQAVSELLQVHHGEGSYFYRDVVGKYFVEGPRHRPQLVSKELQANGKPAYVAFNYKVMGSEDLLTFQVDYQHHISPG
jgi:hypothetical protein